MPNVPGYCLDIGVAAQVSVPVGHYAIVSRNGVARASALCIESVVFPAEAANELSLLPQARDLVIEIGFPVIIPPFESTIYLNRFSFYLDHPHNILVYPDRFESQGRTHYDHHDPSCWRMLRDYMTQHGII